MKSFGFGSLLSLILIFVSANPASASDLVALGQTLTPAYTAMSYERLCRMAPGWSASEPRGIQGTAENYAEQAKNETIDALPEDQSVTVLRYAADAARAEARRQLRDKVILEDKASEAGRFDTWCKGYVSQFISAFISKFEKDHASFLQQLQAEKSSQ